jgi:hypothetical protein
MAALSRTFVLRNDRNAKALWLFLRNNWAAKADSGKPLSVTVQEHKSKRSVEQNRRYWAILNDIASRAWIDGRQFSAEAWHAFFVARFIGHEDTPDGRQVGISTTTLTVGEFNDYMTRVEVYAEEELGIELEP